MSRFLTRTIGRTLGAQPKSCQWCDGVREVEDEGGGIDDVAMELTEFFAACDKDIFGLVAFFGVFGAIEAIDYGDYAFLSAFLEGFVGGFEEFFVDEF